MSNNEYLINFDNIKQEIENFPLEINEGTKRVKEKYKENALQKRNSVVINLIEEYKLDLENVKSILTERMNKMLPNSESADIELFKNKIKLLKKTVDCNNQYNDVYDKIGFEKVLYNIDDIKNYDLKESNNILLYIIKKLESASIMLKPDVFNYSPDTLKYMTVFLEKRNQDDFDESMNALFAQLYWNCPNLLTHLKLNIRYLISMNEKKLYSYWNNQRENLFTQSLTDEYNYLESYFSSKLLLDEAIRKDPYINLKKFLDGGMNIDNYLVSSISRNDVFNKYVKDSDFNNYSEELRNNFYDEIESLKNSIIELQNYKLFESTVRDVIERYKSKDKNKGVYNFKLKQINKLEKERTKKVKKYAVLSKKVKETHKLIERKKTLLSLINSDIEMLNSLYTELDDARINEKIANNINANSSIYDAMVLAGSFYGYLKSMIVTNFGLAYTKEVDDLINKYNEFLLNPNILILKKINLFSDCDLEFMIVQKCKLFGINIDSGIMDNIDTIFKDLEMIMMVRDIESSSLSLENIKFIYEVKKLS